MKIMILLKDLRRAFGVVFANASYVLLGGALAILALLLAAWLPNIPLIIDIVASNAPFIDKIAIVVSLVGSILTNFTPFSASYTIAIAVLFGANVAMVVYFLKRTRRGLQGGDIATGALGIASGVLGVGCAACGSFLLSTVLSSLGAVGALAILPLHGGEFGILGVGLLFFSLVIIARKIAVPLVCTPRTHHECSTRTPLAAVGIAAFLVGSAIILERSLKGPTGIEDNHVHTQNA